MKEHCTQCVFVFPMLAALAIRIQVSLGSVILNYSNRDPQTTAGSLRGFKSKLIITQGKYKVCKDPQIEYLMIVHSIVPGPILRPKERFKVQQRNIWGKIS